MLDQGWDFRWLTGADLQHTLIRPNAGVAQSVEQRTENPRVPGSIPGPGTFSPNGFQKSLHQERSIPSTYFFRNNKAELETKSA